MSFRIDRTAHHAGTHEDNARYHAQNQPAILAAAAYLNNVAYGYKLDNPPPAGPHRAFDAAVSKIAPLAMYTEADLEALVPRKVFDRGLAYYGEYDAMGRIEQKGDTYKAQVKGTETYRVELTVRPSGPLDIYCDCPYDYGPVCKHGIALGAGCARPVRLASGFARASGTPARAEGKQALGPPYGAWPAGCCSAGGGLAHHPLGRDARSRLAAGERQK